MVVAQALMDRGDMHRAEPGTDLFPVLVDLRPARLVDRAIDELGEASLDERGPLLSTERCATGVIPASTAGAKYLRTVFGSTPSDEQSSPIRRPACQCTRISLTSITWIALLANRPPVSQTGELQRTTGRSEGSPLTREFRDGVSGKTVTGDQGIP